MRKQATRVQLKGFSKMLNQVTTLRRENTELIARVRELEVRTPASSAARPIRPICPQTASGPSP